uniref:Neprosin PEP catalytic domain-containing protein n=1 Tax=Oryza meridionalis TaxID=40149 RepID=A0A0E0E3A4_9ORYZ
MAIVLFVGVLLTCFLLLSSASGNGSGRVFSTSQAGKCVGAMGGTAVCKELVNGYYIIHDKGNERTGYITNTYEVRYGFIATMDVYGFSLTPGQLVSYGSVWIITDNGDAPASSLEVFQIGWRVKPGDERPVFDLYCKTSDPSSPLTDPSHMNEDCPGFRPERGAYIRPGDPIPDISQPNGAKQYITLKVFKDMASGDWLVHYGFNNKDPEPIGRIPLSFFKSLSYSAINMWFGGIVVTNVTFQPTPLPPPMGNGYMAVDGGNMAASMKNLQFIDEQGRAWSAENDLIGFSTNENVYTFTSIVADQLFYGGPFRQASLGAILRTHVLYSFLLMFFFYYLFS